MVLLIDTTLREGSQAPHVSFDADFASVLAELLSQLGVTQMEVGHPLASPLADKLNKSIKRRVPTMSTMGHARAAKDDVDAVKACGCDWVGIFLGVNEYSKAYRIPSLSGASTESITFDAVSYAKSLGLKVRFTVEDASRTKWEDLSRHFATAIMAGADRICYADTVGVVMPQECAQVIQRLKHSFTETKVEAHLHNDRGLCMASALAAIEVGVDWLSVSVNGLGERAGIVDLCVLLANLKFMNLVDFPGDVLQNVSKLVAAHARRLIEPERPVTGANVFTHTARLHKRAVARNEKVYSWCQPASLGRTTEIVECDGRRDPASLISKPKVIAASELKFHRDGPGTRFVLIDDRFVRDSRMYCIARIVDGVSAPPSHVDPHVHIVDSLFVFLGSSHDLTGLVAEVTVDGEVFIVESPCAVLIPSGKQHTYRFCNGSGIFLNYVLAGNYNNSLLDFEPKKVIL